MKRDLFLGTCLFSLFLASPSHAQLKLDNEQEIRKDVGTSSYHVASTVSRVKVAVLDNGFRGYVENSDQLPYSTFKPTAPGNAEAETNHGLGMAQILWGVTGRQPEGPTMYLLNSDGFANFKWAIDYAIQKKVDIIVYAQNWEFGGNFDGKGFINAAINKATEKGIIWINAAGNNGGMVYNGDISIDSDSGLVRLPGPEDSLRFKSLYDNNRITFLLAWSDFTDNDDDKTVKDLDIAIYDAAGNEIPTRNFMQQGVAAPITKKGETVPADQNYSSYAREDVTLTLARGDYFIRIKDRSGNFVDGDTLRLNLISDHPNSVDFVDHTEGKEINVGADNPNVITVGDCETYSAQGPTLDGRQKPDVAIKLTTAVAGKKANSASSSSTSNSMPTSLTMFSDGSESMGTSNAAAIFAGTIATMMAAEPAFDKTDLLPYLEKIRKDSSVKQCNGAPIWKTPDLGELIQITR